MTDGAPSADASSGQGGPDGYRPGWWPSPLSAAQVAAPGSRPSEVQVADGSIFWSESRPDEDGRVAVVRWNPERGAVDVVPVDADVRTRVNEYGGGAWRAAPGVVYASLRSDVRVWAIPTDADGVAGEPRPITAECPPDAVSRYADLQLTPDGQFLVCVRERPVPGLEPVQELVAVRVSDGRVSILAAGSSFVADPRISPDGATICWLSWSHPDMPWDATTLWAADLAITGTAMLDIAEPRVVAGGRTALEAGGAPASVSDAAWGPDGALWFASDHLNGYWNAMACPPGLPEAGSGRPVGLGRWEVAQPHWVFGRCRLAPLPGGGALSARRIDGRDVLTLLAAPPGGGQGGGVAVELPAPTLADDVTQVETFSVGSGPAGAFIVAAVVAGADSSPHVRWWHEHDLITTAAEEAGDRPEEGAGAQRHPDGRFLSGPGTSQGLVSLAPEWVSKPQHLAFSTESATEAGAEASGIQGGAAVGHTFALYYPPRNPEVGDVSEPPPLVVRIHGGPTAAAEWRYRADVQFWTTRGFAVADVNYRGSTGYGRPYREALRGAWGVADVADCVTVAEGLAQRGLADPDRLFIRGGSAGGFTALAAVTFHDTFAAAASSYGIADLALLAAETHKFESRYLDGLVGPYPEQAQVYAARSPLFHVDTIDVPVLVLQGSDDPVVPPSQADALVDALRSRGGRVEERRYEGEAHGWRRAQTIIDALETELNFFLSI